MSLYTCTPTMAEFNEEEFVSNNNSETYSEEGQSLRARFSLKDFLSCYETREILEEAFLERFEEKLEGALCELYERVRKDHDEQCTGILASDRGGTGCGQFKNLVWDNIEKSYDLEVFYNNPELATPLLNSIDDIKEEETQLKRRELQVQFKTANRAFDWENKRYV